MPSTINHATYIGNEPGLKGQTALVRYVEEGWVEAQFDNVHIRCEHVPFGFSWWRFPKTDFDIEESRDA